ncbi:hypothetical protein EK904_004963 [Melospiza melodia maxima]|nr:hypothetical protein EK904_004963 [Melospiza melodia maxima]
MLKRLVYSAEFFCVSGNWTHPYKKSYWTFFFQFYISTSKTLKVTFLKVSKVARVLPEVLTRLLTAIIICIYTPRHIFVLLVKFLALAVIQEAHLPASLAHCSFLSPFMEYQVLEGPRPRLIKKKKKITVYPHLPAYTHLNLRSANRSSFKRTKKENYKGSKSSEEPLFHDHHFLCKRCMFRKSTIIMSPGHTEKQCELHLQNGKQNNTEELNCGRNISTAKRLPSDANQGSKYTAVTLEGYVVEDQGFFNKIHEKDFRRASGKLN